MRILIAGATGFVGRNLVPALVRLNHDIVLIGRDVNKIKDIFKIDVKKADWHELALMQPDLFDAVINLAGENISNGRWTNEVKNKIKHSRVETTNKLVAWCLQATQKKPHIYNASAIGIYGPQDNSKALLEPLTESTKIRINQSTDFLSEVGQAWEKAADSAIEANIPVTFMRFAVVLKRREGILKKLELPFSLGFGSILGQGQQAFSWIHIDDLINGIIFLLQHPEIVGPVNLSAPTCVTQKIFAKELANIMHRPLILKTPSSLINCLFGQMGKELLLSGQHVYPERLLTSGFSFAYPTIKSALQHEWPK